ncbi:MAG: hypothetical protein AAGA85_09010 [Bacteroidota bacterium]
MVIRLVLLIFLLVPTARQSLAQDRDFRRQRTQLAVVNVGLSGLVGGLGSAINKPKGDRFWKAFGRGFYRGAIGGLAHHTGMSMTHLIAKHETLALAWPARLVNSFGASIVQNAAEGRTFFERLHFNLYITRLDYYPGDRRLTAKLFTSSIYGMAVVGRGAQLNIRKSLASGIFVWESNNNFSNAIADSFATGQVSSIGMRLDIPEDSYYDIFAHEAAHILQYDRKVGGNALLRHPSERLMERSRFYQGLSRFVYFDLNGPLFWVAYRMVGDEHSCNYFEQEAENYSNRVAYRCINK